MDHDWVRERLTAFVAACNACEIERARTSFVGTPGRAEIELMKTSPATQEILNRLQPGLGDLVRPELVGGVAESRRAAYMGLGILDDREVLTAKLAPDSPSLIADTLHPRIWQAAAQVWDIQQYRLAVGQACGALTAHIANRADSPLADRKLVEQVFAMSDPTRGQVRLHLPGDKRSEDWKNRQQGLHLVAQGAFAGIRNVAAHSSEEWQEQTALELLTVLSVVARWTDQAHRVEPDDVQVVES